MRDARTRGQFAPNILASAAEHEPLAAKVDAERLGVLHASVVRTPLPSEFLVRAKRPWYQDLDDVEEFIPQVVDGRRRQSHSQRGPARDVLRGRVLVGIRMAELLTLIEDGVAHQATKRFGPSVQLVIVADDHVGHAPGVVVRVSEQCALAR